MFLVTPLVSACERVFGKIISVLGLIVWLALPLRTLDTAMDLVLSSSVVYLLVQSAFINLHKVASVGVTEQQPPDLYEHFLACCQHLESTVSHKVYLTSGGGMLNTSALRFFGTSDVVLLSDNGN